MWLSESLKDNVLQIPVFQSLNSFVTDHPTENFIFI